MAPPECTLYNLEDDFDAFLGNSALSYMTQMQVNWNISHDNTTNIDPYAPYLQTCDNGNVVPILPQFELDYFREGNSSAAHLELNLQYKIMAVPTPSELAYRVMPHLQSRFQGHGKFNILGGPYCYGNDALRGYSVDLKLNSAMGSNNEMSSFKRGCVDGLPCTPPAAMGGLPVILPGNQSCDNNSHHGDKGGLVGISMALAFGCYSLGIALMISLTFIWHQSYKHRQDSKRYREREKAEAELFLPVEDGGITDDDISPEVDVNEDRTPLFGRMNLLKGGGIDNITKQEQTVGPFGDLDQAENHGKDPLREPLLEQREIEANETTNSIASREGAY